ncbi:MAG: hypothetical protein RL459_1009 [Pseudomonadota bacterium]|jgi:HemY protein
MRSAIWFLSLFALAVAAALMAGNNQGTITVFWPPYRVDLSLNMVVLVLLAFFVTLHLGLRALSALFAMPAQARRWRLQQRERGILAAMLDAMALMAAGRYVRAQKSAEQALSLQVQPDLGAERLTYADRMRAVSHLLAAQSAQSVQNTAERERHFGLAMEAARDVPELREGLQLRAAQWALADREADGALAWLGGLPQGVARRTLALRLRLEAARLAGKTELAVETARLLSKHRAFSETASQGVLRSLALEWIAATHDGPQLMSVWQKLDEFERQLPEVACAAARRLMTLGGSPALAREWVLPLWDRIVRDPHALTDSQQLSLVQVLKLSFDAEGGKPGTDWLERVESAQRLQARQVLFQYLAGVVCHHLQLWGKSAQMLRAALPRLLQAELQRSAWVLLAEMAQAQGDVDAASQAWKQAALSQDRHTGLKAMHAEPGLNGLVKS